MKITVLGAGAWGTALGWILHQNGHAITFWDADVENLEWMRQTQRNARYLPDLSLPAEWTYETDLEQAVSKRDCLVMAIPSEVFRTVVSRLAGCRAMLVSVTKGIEYDTGITMSGILQQVAPGRPIAALSGPSFAQEVALDIPTAIVAASRDAATAEAVQRLFHRPTFRVYTSTDPLGVELGGAIKNIMAIAAGACKGLGLGDNTRAAMVTRAIAEMRRLGLACGAQAETFAGLSGLGDLMLTCFSGLSRNRELGERIGRGESITRIMAGKHKLAEGYPTSRSAYRLARKVGVSTPIIDEVYAILYEEKNARQALLDLLSRESKAED